MRSTFRSALALLVLTALFAAPLARADLISFTGFQTYDNEYDPDHGGYYLNGHSLAYLGFDISRPGYFDFTLIRPNAGLGQHMNVFAHLYTPEADFGNGIGWVEFPSSLWLQPGSYEMIFSYGDRFTADNAHIDHYVWLGGHVPTPREPIPFTITIEGDGVSVPEPGLTLLMLSGLLGLALRRVRC